jgi:hypothetical protein
MSLSALVTTEGDRSKLREKLRNALNNVPDSPEYNYWLARSAILAGDYATAYTAARRAADFPLRNIVIDPIISPPSVPRPPDGPIQKTIILTRITRSRRRFWIR